MTDSFRHLLGLARALRLAQKGNLALGIRPNVDDAKRLEAAIDHFISEYDHRKATKQYALPDYVGEVMR